jgi:hypothetical protein
MCGSPTFHGLLGARLQRLRKCSKITRAPAIGPIIKAVLVHHGSSFQVGRPLGSNMGSSSTTTQQRSPASHLNAGIRHEASIVQARWAFTAVSGTSLAASVSPEDSLSPGDGAAKDADRWWSL